MQPNDENMSFFWLAMVFLSRSMVFFILPFKNKNIGMEFYDMDWFMLPVSLQKHMLCGIHDIQNGAVLTMGPLGMIDFEKAADV